MTALGPDRVKTQTPGRLFMNFSRFSAFSAITGPAERKNSLQMRRFQTISEFSHGLGRFEPLARDRGRSMVQTEREWLHRVDSGPSPQPPPTARLRRFRSFAEPRANRGGRAESGHLRF